MLHQLMSSNRALRKCLVCAKHLLKFRRGYQTGMGDDEWKTTIEVVNKKIELGLMIESFNTLGFRLNTGMFLIGSVAILPWTIFSWKVHEPYEINEQSLSLFYLMEPKIDILVIGYGDKLESGVHPINRDVIRQLHQRKIYAEILPTENACHTFNFLIAERRIAACALIPPTKFHITQTDVLTSQSRSEEIFKMNYKDPRLG